MGAEEKARTLGWLYERAAGTCVIETDGSGIFTEFGPVAEAFFGCPAEAALGKLHYSAFHDPKEMEACRDDPQFMREIESRGFSEADWRVIPRSGEPFAARVALAPTRALDNAPTKPHNPIQGWIAFYRKLP